MWPHHVGNLDFLTAWWPQGFKREKAEVAGPLKAWVKKYQSVAQSMSQD